MKISTAITNCKKTAFAFLAVLFCLMMKSETGWGQSYTMSNSNITTCSGTYYDPGGPTQNYPTANPNNSKTWKQTIYPGTAGKSMSVAFSSFMVEDGGSQYDYLIIYDGNSTNAPQIGKYSGTNSPGTVTSTAADGSLTFYFYSDYSTAYFGWVASISCVDPPPPSIIYVWY